MPEKKHFQRAVAVSKIGFLPIFSHRIETVTLRKNGIEMQIFSSSLDHLDWRKLLVGSSIFEWLST